MDYPLNIPLDGKGKFFTLQWHLTSRCNHNCRYCYVKKSKRYLIELSHTLSKNECFKVMDDFKEFVSRFSDIGLKGRIVFTGGDPLLRTDLFEILSYANNLKFSIGILGTPDLLDKEKCRRLKIIGVKFYQLSLDGMEIIHDKIRRRGSFKETINGIKILKQAGIKVKIMFTLSKTNKNDLIKVMDLCVKKLKVDRFDFARIVPVNKGMTKEMLNPTEYRKLLSKIFERIQTYSSKEKARVGWKENLWKLFFEEKGKLDIPFKSDKIADGCSIGINTLSITSDGIVFPCRRLNIPIGKVPEETIYDIFFSSKMEVFRQVEKLKKCSKCRLFSICRGCPAIAYNVYGDWTMPDPQCWR